MAAFLEYLKKILSFQYVEKWSDLTRKNPIMFPSRINIISVKTAHDLFSWSHPLVTKARLDTLSWLTENENSKNVVYHSLFHLCGLISVWAYSKYYIYDKLMYSSVHKILKRLHLHIYYEYNSRSSLVIILSSNTGHSSMCAKQMRGVLRVN